MSSATTQPPGSLRGRDHRRFREALVVWLAAGIAAFSILHGLGRLPLMWPDEGRNAEVSREMKESGRWLIPTYNGADYLDKPAFYFKAVSLSLAAFGDTPWAARIPSAVSGFALLVIVFGFCNRVCNSRCASLAVMVIATTPLFLAYARIVIFDIMLTLFTCGAIFAGYLAEETEGIKRRTYYAVGAFAAGLATLVKGPVGFIVPTLVLLIFNRIEGRQGVGRRLLSPLNLLIFFGTVLPWFIGLTLEHPDFPRYGILEESIHRFTTGSFQRSKPIYYYPLIIAVTFFPWSLLVPASIVAAWKRRAAWTRLDRFCVVWAVGVLIFFSISNSKMPGYILSMTVSLGILVARLFDRALNTAGDELRRIPLQAAAILGTLAAAATVATLYLAFHPVELERLLRLDPDEAGRARQFWGPLVALFSLAALLAAAGLLRRSVEVSFAAFLSIPLLAILLNLGVLEFVAARRSAQELSVRLTAFASGATVACLECLPHGLPFYLRRTVTVLTKDGAELSSNYVLFDLKAGSPWPSTLVPVSGRDGWLDRQQEAVVMIARTKSRPVLDRIASERGGRVVALTEDYCALLLPSRVAA